MATVKETLDAIDKKTDELAADVASERADIVEVKALVQSLKDALANNPALEAQAQAALDKLSGVESDLKSTEADLNAVGKDGST